MEAYVVSARVKVGASAAVVWRAITDPQALMAWYASGCRWEIPELREGATLRFFNTATDVQHATIEHVSPAREFAIRWYPDPAFPGASLLNTYVLRDDGTGTEVTISQSGYESAPADERMAWIEADEGAFPAIAAALGRFVDGDSRT